jgi:hypothetical protein
LPKRSLGRWKHIVILVPLGAVFGLAGGLIWNDLLFGVAVGVGFGVAYGLLFALRNAK